jgi:hypothetical protein
MSLQRRGACRERRLLRVAAVVGAILTLAIPFALLAAPASAGSGQRVPTSSTSSTAVGYLGCSLTWQSVNGYHIDGGTRLWPPLPGYGGGEIPKWFEDIANPTPKYWSIFQRQLAMDPADTFWIEACFMTTQIRPSNVAETEAVVRHIRELVPGATIYLSPMNGWDPADSCGKASSAAVQTAQQVTDTLVSEGLVLRGPLLPVLPTTETVDGCHPDDAGQALLGRALLGFFDTAPTTSPGPTFTQTPTDPSGPQATFGFSADGSSESFRCSLDGGLPFACTSPSTFTGLSDGAHTFSVQSRSATDAQPSPAITFPWIVDAVAPPRPTFVAVPTLATSATKAKFSFTDAEAGVTFTCSLDGAPNAVCASPLALSGLSIGLHTFRVRAVDEVGNRSQATGFSWSVLAGA